MIFEKYLNNQEEDEPVRLIHENGGIILERTGLEQNYIYGKGAPSIRVFIDNESSFNDGSYFKCFRASTKCTNPLRISLKAPIYYWHGKGSKTEEPLGKEKSDLIRIMKCRVVNSPYIV